MRTNSDGEAAIGSLIRVHIGTTSTTALVYGAATLERPAALTAYTDRGAMARGAGAPVTLDALRIEMLRRRNAAATPLILDAVVGLITDTQLCEEEQLFKISMAAWLANQAAPQFRAFYDFESFISLVCATVRISESRVAARVDSSLAPATQHRHRSTLIAGGSPHPAAHLMAYLSHVTVERAPLVPWQLPLPTVNRQSFRDWRDFLSSLLGRAGGGAAGATPAARGLIPSARSGASPGAARRRATPAPSTWRSDSLCSRHAIQLSHGPKSVAPATSDPAAATSAAAAANDTAAATSAAAVLAAASRFTTARDSQLVRNAKRRAAAAEGALTGRSSGAGGRRIDDSSGSGHAVVPSGGAAASAALASSDTAKTDPGDAAGLDGATVGSASSSEPAAAGSPPALAGKARGVDRALP